MNSLTTEIIVRLPPPPLENVPIFVESFQFDEICTKMHCALSGGWLKQMGGCPEAKATQLTACLWSTSTALCCCLITASALIWSLPICSANLFVYRFAIVIMVTRQLANIHFWVNYLPGNFNPVQFYIWFWFLTKWDVRNMVWDMQTFAPNEILCTSASWLKSWDLQPKLTKFTKNNKSLFELRYRAQRSGIKRRHFKGGTRHTSL